MKIIGRVVLVCLLAVLSGGGVAQAAVVPCGTGCDLAATVAAASAGDTIQLSSATTYPVTQVLIDKALTIQGGGPTTVIDGGLATLTSPGTLRLTSTGNVTVNDLTVRHPGHVSSGAYAIYMKATGTPAYLFHGVNVIGNGTTDTGLYSEHSTSTLTYEDGSITGQGGNGILVEQPKAAVTIQRNTVSTGTGGSFAIFSLNYQDGTNAPSFKVAGNTITGTAGIGLTSDFANIGAGGFTGPQITGNTITLPAGAIVGVALSNGDTSPTGTGGLISSAVLTGNVITGASAGIGVRLRGVITSPDISGNDITGMATAINSDPAAVGGSGPGPSGVTAHFNRLSHNTSGITNNVAGTIDAAHNWWGCNSGPVAAGCSPVTGAVSFAPWLVLSITASPSTLGRNTPSTITADLLRDSAGATAGGGSYPAGGSVAFSTTLGTVTPGSAPLVNRTASTTFSSSTQGTATVSATYDGQTVSTPVVVQLKPTPPPRPPKGTPAPTPPKGGLG